MPQDKNIKLNKVDLKLLRQLVDSLESSLKSSEALLQDKNAMNSFIVELSKAVGLAAGISQEANLLIGDIQSQVMSVQGAGPAPSDFVKSVLSNLKMIDPGVKGGSGGTGGFGSSN